MATRNFNIINIDEDAELDTPIYRVFNYQKLLALFETNKNTLVKPALWDDPFENFILETATSTLIRDAVYDFGARNRFFGQCWSLVEESDAMWRIYSHDKMGVKVKTTIRKLFDSLLASLETISGRCYIGKVKYIDSTLFKAHLLDESWLHDEIDSYEGQAESLLFKRLEFSHEQEVRLLFLQDSLIRLDLPIHPMQPRNDKSNALFCYSIDPMTLIDGIQFDPRIPKELYDVFKFYLQNKIGYKKVISQSDLYKLPKLYFP